MVVTYICRAADTGWIELNAREDGEIAGYLLNQTVTFYEIDGGINDRSMDITYIKACA